MKITFLFGSGADTQACDKLVSGNAFARALIHNQYKNEVQALLNTDTSHFKFIYPQSKKIFIQTIYSNQEKAKNVLGNDSVEKCVSNYEDGIASKDEVKELCRKWYNIISSDCHDQNEEIRNFFLDNAVLFDTLDGKFNSLRYSTSNSNANRVMATYGTVFVFMLKSLYEIQNDFIWSYQNVFNKLKDPYNVQINPDNYYNSVRRIRGEYYIATPNYTNLASDICECEHDVIYLHGKLTWFEDLDNLTIYDCLSDKNLNDVGKRLIPFILIPSGVKPLICKKQIEQFSAFLHALDECNVLCVVGYKFNSEDNHINTLLGEWLREPNTKMIYFNYDGQLTFSTLRYFSGFQEKIIDSFVNIESLLTKDVKILNVITKKDNSSALFSDFINQYNQRKIQ